MSVYLTPDGNRIIADQDFIDANYPGAQMLEEPKAEPIAAPVDQPIVLNEKQTAVLTAAGLL